MPRPSGNNSGIPQITPRNCIHGFCILAAGVAFSFQSPKSFTYFIVNTRSEWGDTGPKIRGYNELTLREGALIARPRARRYPFAASIELVEMESGAELRGQTTDISLFGCLVNVSAPWVTGSRVRLRIVRRGAVLSALGVVANVRTKGGMGVVFTKIEEKQQLVLEKWLTELRDTHERISAKR